jgi:hypothetical protein
VRTAVIVEIRPFVADESGIINIFVHFVVIGFE